MGPAVGCGDCRDSQGGTGHLHHGDMHPIGTQVTHTAGHRLQARHRCHGHAARKQLLGRNLPLRHTARVRQQWLRGRKGTRERDTQETKPTANRRWREGTTVGALK